MGIPRQRESLKSSSNKEGTPISAISCLLHENVSTSSLGEGVTQGVGEPLPGGGLVSKFERKVIDGLGLAGSENVLGGVPGGTRYRPPEKKRTEKGSTRPSREEDCIVDSPQAGRRNRLRKEVLERPVLSTQKK